MYVVQVLTKGAAGILFKSVTYIKAATRKMTAQVVERYMASVILLDISDRTIDKILFDFMVGGGFNISKLKHIAKGQD